MKRRERNVNKVRRAGGLLLPSILVLAVGLLGIMIGVQPSGGANAAQASAKKLKWELTAELATVDGRRSIYGFEDTEYKIVCYAAQTDLSGGIGCVKK